ncbi:zinc finger FYVE domain-containing protein 1-like [Oncorhynchus kisutch]|uniref:zinc finger FYVE domain-containing protein 1-like n=1 Tax=Oncorhynchus kisutch TaxID=8019 RepID=UPI0012DDC0EA|nr:zinc finger FYVE domain-containing protein 1-like [Oncorhynchus kisutch]
MAQLALQYIALNHPGGLDLNLFKEVYSLPLPEIIEVKSTPHFKPAEINLSPVVDEAEVPKAKLLEKVFSCLLIDANEACSIYRTHADRIHDDLFKFLGDGSEAYLKHFTKELKATTARCGLDVPLSTLGQAIIIFHETVHTKLLGSGNSSESVDWLLLEPFRKLGRFPEVFSSILYLGTCTCSPPNYFGGLQHTLEQLLDNNSTRFPVVIFKALQ